MNCAEKKSSPRDDASKRSENIGKSTKDDQRTKSGADRIMKKTEDIIFALGMIAFILAVCGYDGQPVICGAVSMMGLSSAYLGYRRSEKKKRK